MTNNVRRVRKASLCLIKHHSVYTRDIGRVKGKAGPRTDHGAGGKDEKYTSTLSSTSELDWFGDRLHDVAALRRGKKPGTHFTGGRMGPRNSLDGHKKSRPTTGFLSPYRPAHSESLYRLSYRGR